MSEVNLDSISPTLRSSKKEVSFFRIVMKKRSRSERPIFSLLTPYTKSRRPAKNEPTTMMTTHYISFSLKVSQSPAYMASIVTPMNAEEVKSCIEPKNDRGMESATIPHCSHNTIFRSLLAAFLLSGSYTLFLLERKDLNLCAAEVLPFSKIFCLRLASRLSSFLS